MDKIYERLHDDTAEIEDETNESSEIQNFFAGQTVFLTGCTGFVGKMFVEKLLRSCWSIKRLYVLVRPKKHSTQERMKQYFDNVVFDRLKEENPNFQLKVSTIEGDLMKDDLALSETDRTTLVNETTLIYHNASNVKFDEIINVAIRTNVFGTKNMLDLAKQCNKLVAFIYVSTAYSHCYKQHIKEQFYPPPANMKMISDILDADVASAGGLDEATLKTVRGQWPNNYVFTKSTAESLIEECAKEVPFSCIVFRPSMVTLTFHEESKRKIMTNICQAVVSTYLEPIRAWCGNINGPAGLMLGNCLGFMHAFYKATVPVDYVPADMCTNALIALSWDGVVNKKAKGEGIVYNYGSTVANKITGKQFQEKGFVRGQDLPSVYMMGSYYTTYTNCIWYYWLLHLTIHLWPVLLADAVLLCRGQKTRALAFWLLATKNMSSLVYFASGNWRIYVDRMQTLWDRMNRRDSELFFCDLRKLSWDEYCYAYWAGLRVYVLKDPMNTVKAGTRHWTRLKVIDNCLYYMIQIWALYYVGRFIFPILPSIF